MFKSFIKDDHEINYITDVGDLPVVYEYVDKFLDISLDVETNNTLDPHDPKSLIRLVQIAVHPKSIKQAKIFVLDLWKLGQDNKINLLPWFLDLKNLLRSRQKIRGQNLTTELKMFWMYGIDLSVVPLWDTMIGSQLLYMGSDLAHNLKSIVYRETGVELDKSMQMSDWSVWDLAEEQIPYAALDTAYLAQVEASIIAKLKRHRNPNRPDRSILNTILPIEMEHICFSAMLEYNGIYVDRDKLESFIPIYQDRIKDLTLQFHKSLQGTKQIRSWHDEITYNLNLASPAQLKHIFALNNLPLEKTDKKALSELDWTKYPAVGSIGQLRNAEKVYATHIQGVLNNIHPHTGRVHYDVFQLKSSATGDNELSGGGTLSGRIAIKNPAMQTMPRSDISGKFSLREACRPQFSNWQYLVMDLSQIEARLVAELAYKATNRSIIKDYYLKGIDVYIASVLELLKITYDDWLQIDEKERKSLRQAEKPKVLGLMYGMGKDRFQEYLRVVFNLHKTIEEVIEMRQKFLYTQFPELPEWHKLINKQWENKEFIYNLNGRLVSTKKHWIDDDGIERYSVGGSYSFLINWPVQSLATDIMKDALNTIFRFLRDVVNDGYPPLLHKSSVLPVMYLHDEIDMEGDEELLQSIFKPIQSIVENVGGWHIDFGLPIKLEGSIGNNWAAAK